MISVQNDVKKAAVPTLTSVFQLIGSTKPFTTSAIISAPTLARPTMVGSRFMHVSQVAHWCIIAGMGLDVHKLLLYCEAHIAISCTMSLGDVKSSSCR